MRYKIRISNPMWGVPVTILDKINTSQFKIIGIATGNTRKNNFNYLLDPEKCPVFRLVHEWV